MSIKKLSAEFANEFSVLVSHTAAMMPAAAALALDPGDLVGAVAVFPTSFLDMWQDHSVADVAQFTGAIWQVMLRRYPTSNAVIIQTSATGKKYLYR